MPQERDGNDTVRRPRKSRRPRTIAVINADQCTGCEACIAVCPVDCIELIESGLQVKGIDSWCEVDMTRCIGCGLCVSLPRRRSQPYELKICPWDAIDMVPRGQLPEVVANIGGPGWYVERNRERLLETARHLSTP
jgi:electron transport complex protein RnfB